MNAPGAFMEKPISFEIQKKIPQSLARVGVIHTPHGDIETPAFVVVGTKGTVKTMRADDFRESVGNSPVICNTYHLYLQPGHELVKKAGGLHAFMGWKGPLMTDSGGFQVFSLGAAFGKGVSKFVKEEVSTDEADAAAAADARPTVYSKDLALSHGKLCVIDEEGVTFTSHIDGSLHRFTAERSIEIQHDLGADIIFAFDECTSPSAPYEYQKEALERTMRWAKRSILAHKRDYNALKTQGLYGIVQGGRFTDLRQESARGIAEMDFDGFGIGGSFSKEDLGDSLRVVNEILPEEKPRHLLGIGEPEDFFPGIEQGCDTFDCVVPTRLGRNGTLYTRGGKIHIKNAEYREDLGPIDPECGCEACAQYSRAYIAHLFRADEILGPHLGSLHNMYFLTNLVKDIRTAMLEDRYEAFKESFLAGYKK